MSASGEEFQDEIAGAEHLEVWNCVPKWSEISTQRANPLSTKIYIFV
jgi:hypothetical protein